VGRRKEGKNAHKKRRKTRKRPTEWRDLQIRQLTSVKGAIKRGGGESRDSAKTIEYFQKKLLQENFKQPQSQQGTALEISVILGPNSKKKTTSGE